MASEILVSTGSGIWLGYVLSEPILTHHQGHDDIIKWKHFPQNWPFVRGIHRSPVEFPHKGQWHRALMFSLICAWTNGWANNRDAGDMRPIVLIMTSLQRRSSGIHCMVMFSWMGKIHVLIPQLCWKFTHFRSQPSPRGQWAKSWWNTQTKSQQNCVHILHVHALDLNWSN